jgi:hypothetical protein
MISQDEKKLSEGTPKNIESPVVLNRDTAPAYWLLDALWVILATALIFLNDISKFEYVDNYFYIVGM